jgi:diguanylate cyclase (GGDEF)-like protein/PAS domain S-box-containing protein
MGNLLIGFLTINHMHISKNILDWLKVYSWQDIVWMFVLASLYVLLSIISLTYFSIVPQVSLVWTPSGLAIAALLIGGKKFWPGVFLGALCANIFAGTLTGMFTIAVGNTLEALLCVWLLSRIGRFDKSLTQPLHYLWLNFAGAVSACVSALIGTTGLYLAGSLTQYYTALLHWWLGDFLGIIMLTPTILVWRKLPVGWFKRIRVLETITCFGLAFLFGQVIFLNWFHDSIGFVKQDYWLLLFVVWGAVRFGRHGALLIISMAVIQSLLSVVHGVGFFANDIENSGLFNVWLFMLILVVIGVTLALIIDKRKMIEEKLLYEQQRTKDILTGTNAGTWYWNIETEELIINDRWAEIIGYTLEELMPVTIGTWSSSLHESDLKNAEKMLEKHFNREHDYYDVEFRQKHKNGDWVWVNARGKVIEWDSAGNPIHMSGTHLDITERKKLTLDLANRSKQLIQNQFALWELAKEEFSNQTTAFNKIITADAEQLNVERVSVWLFDEAHTKIMCKALYHDGEINNEEIVLSADQYPNYFKALADRGFIMANDACNNIDTNEFTENYLIPLNIKSMMDIPIHLQGEIVGIVCHEHTETIRVWSLEDEDFAKSISDMCALSMAAFENKRSEQKLSYQASHDDLTGLVNRYEFERRTKRLLSTIRNDGSVHALCFMDLDQFKIVNDTCGHSVGDEMLRQLSSMLSTSVRQRDTLARLGGDEFAVLMEHCSLDDAHRVAKSLQSTIQDFQFSWESKIFKVGVSIGLVPITDDSMSVKDLLIQADTACYMAKDQGRNRIHIYHAEDKEIAQRQGEMQWISRLNHALEEDKFSLYAQPIVSLNDSKDEHYEFLIRMIDENNETIPPGAFLSAAERFNLMSKIDRWVVINAFKKLSNQHALLEKINFFSINLSGQSITDNDFLNFMVKQLEKMKVPGEKICFEITETAAISNLSEAISFISAMKEFGCRFALDDFGSGLSSFGYLKNLPVDYLKIDGMFVKDIVSDPIDLAMVKSINEIGHVMGMQTIAEFVENDTIRDMLKDIGVDYVQGYGIGMPIDFDLILEQNNDNTKQAI